MRITDNYIYNLYISNLNDNMGKIASIQEKNTTGKKINRPSDNPINTARVLELDDRLMRNEQFQNNISEAKAFLNFTQSALQDAQKLMKKAYELALRGADATLDSDERQSLAIQVDQILQELIDVSRKKYQDKYVFGGTRTLEQPFHAYTNVDNEEIVYDGTNKRIALSHSDIRKKGYLKLYDINGKLMDLGKDYDVDYENGIIKILDGSNMTKGKYVISYQSYDVNFDSEKIVGVDENEKGIRDLFYQEIDNGIVIAINISGYEAFEKDINIFDTLINLRKALENNEQDKVNALISPVKKGIQQIMDNAALAGTRIQRLNLTADRLVNNKLSIQELKSDIQDIDLAKSAMELQKMRNIYQAAIYSGRLIFESTLVNFLR